MRQLVYFDTNAFLDLYKLRAGVTKRDVNLIAGAITGQRVAVCLSIYNVDEILANLAYYPQATEAEYKFMLNMACDYRLVKPQDQLFREHIACYCAGLPLTNYFETDEHLYRAINGLNWSDPYEAVQLLGDLEQSREMKQANCAAMTELRNIFLERAAHIRESKPTFHDLWSSSLPENLASRLVMASSLPQESQSMDVAGLLDVRCVRLWIAMLLSRWYAQFFEGRTPKRSDLYDGMHAVSAAGADIFVTHDEEFARLLSRTPVEGLQVMDLGSFVRHICG